MYVRLDSTNNHREVNAFSAYCDACGDVSCGADHGGSVAVGEPLHVLARSRLVQAEFQARFTVESKVHVLGMIKYRTAESEYRPTDRREC